jgi:hypothetical protein
MGRGPQVALRGKTRSAIVTANRMAGPLSVTNPAKANLQIGLNVFQEPPKRPTEEAGVVVVDDSDGPSSVTFTGTWLHTQNTENQEIGYYLGTRWAWKGAGDAKAVFKPEIPTPGRYTVYAYFGPDPIQDHASNAPVEVRAADGVHRTTVNLRPMKGQWVKLGAYPFKAGRTGSITFSNDADGNVLADAVKVVRSGR